MTAPDPLWLATRNAEFQNLIKASLRQGLLQAAATATSASVVDLQALAEALRVKLGYDKDVAVANAELAKGMQTAVLRAYERTVGGPGARLLGSYERRNRLAGRLRPALEDPQVFVSSAASVSVNFARLSAGAAHWARLNFGALPAPGAHAAPAAITAPKQYQLTFHGVPVGGAIGVPGRARPPFFMPIGVFGAAEGEPLESVTRSRNPKTGRVISRFATTEGTGIHKMGQVKSRPFLLPYTHASGGYRSTSEIFRPLRGVPIIPTRGIASANFMDAGFAYLARAMDNVYRKLLDAWVSSVGLTVQQPKKYEIARVERGRIVSVKRGGGAAKPGGIDYDAIRAAAAAAYE